MIRKQYSFSLVAVIIMTGWICFANWANRNDNGIVTVPNWENGVAFCGKEYGAVVFTDEASFEADGTATYVINKGHYNDPQVKILKWEAKASCGNN